MRSCLVTLFALALVGLQSSAADAGNAPTPDELIRAGQNTLDKLSNAPASWNVMFQTHERAMIKGLVVRDRDRKSWRLSFVDNDRVVLLFRLVQMDGFWFLIEAERKVKCRPYEADFSHPEAYRLLAISEPHAITNTEILAGVRLEGRSNGITSCRRPLSATERLAVETLLAGLEARKAKDPELVRQSNVQAVINHLQELLAKGDLIRVDETTGVIVQANRWYTSIIIDDFRWLDKLPTGTFPPTEYTKWEDQSAPYTVEDLENCVMVGRDPRFVVGEDAKLQIEAYLLNLKTRSLRRLPFRGAFALPGCFLKDRKEVIISGQTADGTALFKLDLLTGENRPVLKMSKDQFEVCAAISPDGNTMAMVRNTSPNPESQIQLVDLQSWTARPLGKPLTASGAISWLPDSQGFILTRQDNPDARGPKQKTLVRMGLDGTSTDLRPGSWPVVLHKSRQILFQDNDTELWHTCHLDGSNPELYAEGMRGYFRPAMSPDETRLVFVREVIGQLPDLVLFEFGKTRGSGTGRHKGYSNFPVWR